MSGKLEFEKSRVNKQKVEIRRGAPCVRPGLRCDLCQLWPPTTTGEMMEVIGRLGTTDSMSESCNPRTTHFVPGRGDGFNLRLNNATQLEAHVDVTAKLRNRNLAKSMSPMARWMKSGPGF